VKADDTRVQAWPVDRVEAFRDEAQARERGFASADSRPSRAMTRTARVAVESSSRGGRSRPNVRARTLRAEAASPIVTERFAAVDWNEAARELATRGVFTIGRLLDARRCRALREAWGLPELFERTIDMAPRGYGVGTYRYFKEPLPEPAFTMRDALYTRLLPLARAVPSVPEYPETLAEFFERCRAAGQRRGSSIVLEYDAGGVNHPHRDIYGKLWFPYQAVLVLSARGDEFEGGELELCTATRDGVEHVRRLPLDQGDLCVFASRGYWQRSMDDARSATDGSAGRGRRARGKRAAARAREPSETARGAWVEMKHGLTPIVRGRRAALGIVLHLAQ
jgi:hypothetical protein